MGGCVMHHRRPSGTLTHMATRQSSPHRPISQCHPHLPRPRQSPAALLLPRHLLPVAPLLPRHLRRLRLLEQQVLVYHLQFWSANFHA